MSTDAHNATYLKEQDMYPHGTEVNYWTPKGEMKYATVQSCFVRPSDYMHRGPTILLVVKLNDAKGTITCLPADTVTILEAGPVCSPVTMMYRLLAKL
ncbi:hypothetical protein D9619_009551 [Psilocybe cf. subviscida]|uniref:Uncharacterized protein n=1 Tax=Psilocybe cf. subviscida TaxID=2480587 RepID=A0A8H5F620_9AGAR|nr:hypothetical protein D9619_009551 [Psilocybe cf. subviscida]